jgi:glycosyltransferase involved in cell wall biosynthesis
MKICIIDNKSFWFLKFRQPLIKQLLGNGHQVTAVVTDGLFKEEIEKMGISCVVFPLSNRSLNPFSTVKYYKFLVRFLSSNHFDLVLTFQLKPNIFGCIAAKKAKVKKIVATIEGLGDPFLKKGLKWSLIRKMVIKLYRRALKNVSAICCLNKDSISLLLRNHIGKACQYRLFYGVGVDIEHYGFSKIVNYSTFLMVSRLNKTKGVVEFCSAARLCKGNSEGRQLKFVLVGPYGDIGKAFIDKFIEDGSIEYAGEVKDPRANYRDCGCFVLPSYGEGLPMSTMEAMSTGRPIITTDVMGCRETVSDGVNGFVVPVADSRTLADTFIFLSKDKLLMDRMGEESRRVCCERFSSTVTTHQFVLYLESL